MSREIAIGPHDLLPVGSRVRVGGLYGIVIKAQMVPASNGGEICQHTMRFDEKSARVPRTRRVRLVPLEKAVTKSANYAFIYLLPEQP